jgi:hypothetical protein
MFDLITRAAFVDEMVKIAQEEYPGMTIPEKQPEKVMNKEVLKRFLLDAGVVALGLGAGYGVGTAAHELLKRPGTPKWVKPAVMMAGPVIGATGAMLLQSKVKDVQNRRLAEAYRMGQLAKESQ